MFLIGTILLFLGITKNINNLVWYTDLSGYLKSKKDLFEDAKKELEIE